MKPLLALVLLLVVALLARWRTRRVEVDDIDWLHAACDPWTERMASNA